MTSKGWQLSVITLGAKGGWDGVHELTCDANTCKSDRYKPTVKLVHKWWMCFCSLDLEFREYNYSADGPYLWKPNSQKSGENGKTSRYHCSLLCNFINACSFCRYPSSKAAGNLGFLKIILICLWMAKNMYRASTKIVIWVPVTTSDATVWSEWNLIVTISSAFLKDTIFCEMEQV